MNKYDKYLRRNAGRERVVMPEEMSENIDDILEMLLERTTSRKRQIFPVVSRVAAGLLIALFIIMPNINAEVAYAMSKIPVVGSFVKVITIAEYNYNDEYHSENVKIPEVELDGSGQSSLEDLNLDIKTQTDMAIELFRETCEQFPDAHLGLYIDYETITNTENWFALKLIIASVSANNSVELKYYNIDKENGTVVSLSELFVEDFDYVTALSEELCRQMSIQNEEFGEVVYWVYTYNELETVFDKIYEEQNYYFNEAGELVIVLDKYQAAPGYIGCPEFVIPREVYEAFLTVEN